MEAKYGALAEAKIDDNWTQADQDSAVAKVRRVAGLYDSSQSGRGGGGLDTVADAYGMTPTQFKSSLRLMFGITLTAKELSALVAYFDKDGDKLVDGAEFLSTFFNLGKAAKSKDRKRRKQLDKKLLRAKVKLRQDHLDRFAKQVQAKIIYPQVSLA